MPVSENHSRAEEPPPAASSVDKASSATGGLGWLWAGLGLSVVIIAGGAVAWLLLVRPAEKAAGGLRDTVVEALETITGEQFTVASNTITLQKAAIAEFNVIQRKAQTMIKMETTVFGSKATLILRGDFIVKAGYDLSKPLTVTVDDASDSMRAASSTHPNECSDSLATSRSSAVPTSTL